MHPLLFCSDSLLLFLRPGTGLSYPFPGSLAQWGGPGQEPNFSALGCVNPAEGLLLKSMHLGTSGLPCTPTSVLPPAPHRLNRLRLPQRDS